MHPLNRACTLLNLSLIAVLLSATSPGRAQAPQAQAKEAPSPAEPQVNTDYLGPPSAPATEAQVREYMALAGIAKTAHDVMDAGVKAMQLSSAPYYPASFWQDMRAAMLKIDITALYIPVFQHHYSQTEMQSIIDFYRSPAGHRLLLLQPMMVDEVKPLMQKQGEAIGLAVYEKHKEEIEELKAKYDAVQSK